MLKQLKNKPKIGIVRGLDVRLQQAEFASFFKRIDPVFASEYNYEIKEFLKSKNTKFISLNLKPYLFFDPVSVLFGKRHQSWLNFKQADIEKFVKGVDMVQIYEPYFFYSAQVSEVAKRNNKLLITEIWTSFPNHPANFIPPYSLNVKTVIKNTDFFIARSRKALSYLHPFDIEDKRKKVIYPGINLDRFSPKVKQGGQIKIFFAGVLSSHKGADDILKVFPKLFKKYKTVKLIICGRGPMEKKIKEMGKDLPVEYLGQVSNLKIPELYDQADIFCGPSKEYSTLGIKRWEEFVGYTFIEAMACGLPIVATRCGGIPEIIGSENLLIREGDQEALLTALSTLIESKKLRDKIGQDNRKRAEKMFDLKKQVAEMEEIICDIFFTNSKSKKNVLT